MKKSKYIDHTLLKATATYDEILNLCNEAKEYDFASVCVNPANVTFAHQLLEDTDVKVCTVIGFPLGANTPAVKAFETTDAITNGADEVDMVINIGMAKAHNWDAVYEDIKAVVDAANGVLVKVIIETCYLTDEEKEEVCKLAVKAGADFVKTSTGFGTGGATKEDVALMAKAVAGKAQVKASGGIRDKAAFEQMIEAGATRVGCSAGVKIMEGYKNE
jgi:deoxyribose-phosphate aldolase